MIRVFWKQIKLKMALLLKGQILLVFSCGIFATSGIGMGWSMTLFGFSALP